MRAAATTVMAALLVACSSEATARPSPSSSLTPRASGVSTECGSTAVLRGGIPSWLDQAGGYNNPSSLPYVIAHPAQAAGFIFTYPLRAGQRENPSNKILWVVRVPRTGPLTIDGHPLGATAPIVHEVRPANSGPGEIYPDGVDVPNAGCWQFDLRWANSHVQVELDYTAT